MVFHPHVHFIVPAGAVSDDGSTWCRTPENFRIPATVAPKIYRQKFREALRDAGHEDDASNVRWLVWLFRGWTYWLASDIAPQTERIVTKSHICEKCGENLKFVEMTFRSNHLHRWSLLLRQTEAPPAKHKAGYIDTGTDCYEGLMKYFKFYGHERPHQSLDYRTPWEVHNSSS